MLVENKVKPCALLTSRPSAKCFVICIVPEGNSLNSVGSRQLSWLTVTVTGLYFIKLKSFIKYS